MRTALSQLSLAQPRSVDHALRLLRDAGGRSRLVPIAGGTDLFVYLQAGSLQAKDFLDLSGLDELRRIRATRSGISIGALATFAEIGRHPGVRRLFPSLVAAAGVVGAITIQNRATLGGNIVNASPAGDSLPVLLAHDAVVRVRGAAGERTIPHAELHTGYRTLAMAPDELVIAIELPAPPAGAKHFFRKIGTRAAQSISKVVLAGVLHVRRGAVDHARMAWGSVAPTPLRSRRAEDVVLGKAPSLAVAVASAAALGTDIAPIDDIRSDREYRLAVARNVLAQFLRTAHASFARD